MSPGVSEIVVEAMNGPIDWDLPDRKHQRGQHRDFHGKPYRRGKNRCAYCGARLPANEVLDQPPYQTNREALRQNITARNALLQRLMAGREAAPQ
jgi:hypothetical protein